jgi:biopolymer transport protein TolR
MAMGSGSGPGGLNADINVTPLIDVLLVLLIIFMVLVHNRGEQVEIPQPSSIPVPGPEPVVVLQLTDAGEGRSPAVTIDRTEVGWEKLDSALREIRDKRKEKAVFLKGDPEIDFQYVAEAVDIAHHAGVDRVGLMAQ